MTLKHHAGLDLGIDLTRLAGLCDLVASLSGRPIPKNKPVVGESMFEHESGIHVEGLLKDSTSFEPFGPEEVGRTRRIVIGKHSGTTAISWVLRQNDIHVDRDTLAPLAKVIGRESSRLRRALSEEEVLFLHESHPRGRA